ncbi:MAG TPA: hypothetical protein VLZ28_00655 [Daejeonella sp.]|nr:hypothetical protein [Daejeonella sp.]
MFWIIIALIFLLIIAWLLLSPIEMDIDTRVPHAYFNWITIGKALVIYENEDWFLKVRVLMFHKEWALSKMLLDQPRKKNIKKKSIPEKSRKGRTGSKIPWRRFLKMCSTFRVTEWQLALDANDHFRHIVLYPFNFFPYIGKHLFINFEDQTYFFIRMRNQPWRILYAWIK